MMHKMLPSYETSADMINWNMQKVFIYSIAILIHLLAKRLVEPYNDYLYIVQNPPAKTAHYGLRWMMSMHFHI